jgi:hypothetical protein
MASTATRRLFLNLDIQLGSHLRDLAGDRGGAILRLFSKQVGILGVEALAALLFLIHISDELFQVGEPLVDLRVLGCVGALDQWADVLVDDL